MQDRKITNTAKGLLIVWNIGLFVLVWFGFYNQYTFDRYWMMGGAVSSIIYSIIYLSLCRVYLAFRIASVSITDTVFGQVISFGIADLLLYVECCLINNHYVDVWYGVLIVVLQVIGTAGVVLWTKRYMMKHLIPQKTMILFGGNVDENQALHFGERLISKYGHLFAVTAIHRDTDIWEKIKELITAHDVVVLYESSAEHREKFMDLCVEQKKSVYFTPRIEDIFCQVSQTKHLLDTPMMKYEPRSVHRSEYFGKRLFDICFSVLFLVLFSPVFLITAIAIKLEDGGPIFYLQKRCTKDGKVFCILKFRSMVVDAESMGAIPCGQNDNRITKVGNVIRPLRIDEIPQFLNVLKGEMSIVGPRPERVEHVKKYTEEIPEFSYRLSVKGGLTGYAQIFGKYNTTAFDKLRLDLMYIEKQSLITDLRVMMLTVRTIFQKESTEGFVKEK